MTRLPSGRFEIAWKEMKNAFIDSRNNLFLYTLKVKADTLKPLLIAIINNNNNNDTNVHHRFHNKNSAFCRQLPLQLRLYRYLLIDLQSIDH